MPRWNARPRTFRPFNFFGFFSQSLQIRCPASRESNHSKHRTHCRRSGANAIKSTCGRPGNMLYSLRQWMWWIEVLPTYYPVVWGNENKRIHQSQIAEWPLLAKYTDSRTLVDGPLWILLVSKRILLHLTFDFNLTTRAEPPVWRMVTMILFTFRFALTTRTNWMTHCMCVLANDMLVTITFRLMLKFHDFFFFRESNAMFTICLSRNLATGSIVLTFFSRLHGWPSVMAFSWKKIKHSSTAPCDVLFGVCIQKLPLLKNRPRPDYFQWFPSEWFHLNH